MDRTPNEVDQVERSCSACANFARPGEPHHWRWWEWVPALVMAMAFIGGIVLWSQRQADASVDLDRRMTTLEKRTDKDENSLQSVSERLAGIEPMLQFIVKRLGGP